MDGKSFDLGANYITPDYPRTLALAEEMGAETFVAQGIQTAAIGPDGIQWEMPPPDDPAVVFAAMTKYLEIRKTLTYLDRPVLTNLPDEVLVTFQEWLAANDLSVLEPLFWVPITTMGYGFLDEIPAVYALKFMSPGTFLPIFLRALPQMQGEGEMLERVVPWPKKFVDGFQRLWERVSWQLDVRLNVTIHEVQRDGQTIRIDFEQQGRSHSDVVTLRDERSFDALVLACPLDVATDFMKLEPEEAKVFSRIRFNSYVVSSYSLKAPIEQIHGQAVAFVPPGTLGEPWAIAQVWKGESHLVQFFNRVDPARPDEEVFESVRDANLEVLAKIPAEVDEDETWTLDRWPYFQHYGVQDLRDGVLDDLQNLQGTQATWYAGGGSHFELVESAMDNAHHVVSLLRARFS